jgi:hypothetical protein
VSLKSVSEGSQGGGDVEGRDLLVVSCVVVVEVVVSRVEKRVRQRCIVREN